MSAGAVMIASIASIAVLAVVAPFVHRALGRWSGMVLASVPLAFAAMYASFLPAIGSVAEIEPAGIAWVAELGVRFSFYLDGLSLLFALLVTGFGGLITLYAGSYLDGHPLQGRFYSYFLGFMVSMLGLVLADNVLLLFIFWELTSITSYLLIGFDHDRLAARKAALQALVVTGLGGLAMLAGLVLLALVSGETELSALVSGDAGVREHGAYPAIVILVLAGCFTKSAQFPFHFWLPGAMQAPSPVSAYLHSSTMVKAGVYLLARLNPALGGTAMWTVLLVVFGGVTMLVGAYLATRKREFKPALAYTTVSSLGILVMLIGLGAGAAKAAAGYLLAHALFKGCLFLVAGTVTHETHEKDVEKLGGLARLMPWTAAAGLVAALSMAGVPLFLGFAGKELLLKSALAPPDVIGAWGPVLAVAAGVMAVMTVMVSLRVGWLPFFARASAERSEEAGRAHEAPWPMLAGPVLLAGLSVVGALLPWLFAVPVVASTAASITGTREHFEEGAVQLGLGYLLSPGTALYISLGALVLGAVLYAARGAYDRVAGPADRLAAVGPERIYEALFSGVMRFAGVQTTLLQSGYLRIYIKVIFLTLLGLMGAALMRSGDVFEGAILLADMTLLEAVLVVIVLIATVATTVSRSRLATIAVLGVIGYSVAVLFLLFGAPDLTMTQFSIETLTVIIFILVLYHLPRFMIYSSTAVRIVDAVIALSFGALMTTLVLVASSRQIGGEPISAYFNEMAVPGAYGRNIVNVILVDFRAMDTFGEILVLGIAAVGVLTLLRVRARKGEGVERGRAMGDEGARGPGGEA